MIDAIPLLLAPEGYQISRSVRLRSSASATFSRTPASAGNTTKGTFSFWIKRGALSTAQQIYHVAGTSGNNSRFFLAFNVTTDTFSIVGYNSAGAVALELVTTQVFRDPSSWYHIVIYIDTTQASSSNRVILYINGAQVSSFGTSTIPAQNTALGFTNNTASLIGANQGSTNFFDGYLTEINFIDGQALTPSSFGQTNYITGVWSPIKYTGTYGTNGFYLNFSDNSGTSQNLLNYSEQADNAYWTKSNITVSANSTTAPNGATTADTLLETVTNGIHCLTNASSITVVSSATYTASVYIKAINKQFVQLVFDNTVTTNGGYANFDLTNGSVTQSFNYGTGTNINATITSVGSGWYRIALTTSIGATTAARLAIVSILTGTSALFEAYAGNTSNGYYVWGMQLNAGSLPGMYLVTVASAQASTNNLGQDLSVSTGGYNNWTPNNISVTAGTTYDSMLDVPTQWADGGNGRGNYCVLNPLDTSQNGSAGTLTNGNLTRSDSTATNTATFGTMFVSSGQWYYELLVQAISATTANLFAGIMTNNKSVFVGLRPNGTVLNCTTPDSGTYTTNDVLGVAVDIGANRVYVYKNGTLIHTLTPTTALTDFTPSIADGTGATGAVTASFNFGQRPFEYTPPTGFRALNTQNLPTPTILKGNQFFDVSTWTGNASTQSIVNSGAMQPDLVWAKARAGTAGGTGHIWQDAVRGLPLYLQSNTTAAEASAADHITSFNSNGFSMGAGGSINAASTTYVGWQWKEGATQGFDIVTYTGNSTANRTIAHSLGVTPSMIIVKNRSAVQNWPVAHTSLAANNLLLLDTTNATISSGTRLLLGNSSTFTVGDAADYGITNQTSQNYVAYLFAAVAGFSRFGSYTGNGSADGPFVFLGFRPRFVLIKETTAASTSDWIMHDTARAQFNADDLRLLANSSGAELNTGFPIDELSNGFKVRNTGNGANRSGGTYIFAAFAENPFKNALAR